MSIFKTIIGVIKSMMKNLCYRKPHTVCGKLLLLINVTFCAANLTYWVRSVKGPSLYSLGCVSSSEETEFILMMKSRQTYDPFSRIFTFYLHLRRVALYSTLGKKNYNKINENFSCQCFGITYPAIHFRYLLSSWGSQSKTENIFFLRRMFFFFFAG